MAINRNRKNERGVTIIVVAFILVAILAMAALAVDVAELYVARGEVQRAANAGALAGAKIFANSSFTSTPAIQDPTNTALICQAVNTQATAIANQNPIAGQTGGPSVAVQVQCPYGASLNPENPMVAVTVTRTGVPAFFARIWGRTGTTVSATAYAEAFNPSGTSTNPATTPIATAIKPWLVPNCNPQGPACTGPWFVDPTSGQILQNGSFIGQTIDLNVIRSGTPQGRVQPSGIGDLDVYPLTLPTNTQPVCPACALGQTSYYQGIACASQEQLSCQDTVGSGTNYPVRRFGVTGVTNLGGQCLIHSNFQDGPNHGQDLISLPTAPNPPVVITPGSNNPNPNFDVPNINISRSDSIVTLPLYDGSAMCTAGGGGGGGGGFGSRCTVTKPVVGFLQLAITQTIPQTIPPTIPTAQIEGVIMNVSGCGNNPTGTPVSGSGTSPVPVRLIQKPTP